MSRLQILQVFQAETQTLQHQAYQDQATRKEHLMCGLTSHLTHHFQNRTNPSSTLEDNKNYKDDFEQGQSIHPNLRFPVSASLLVDSYQA
ncbi:hypothetical protein ES708_20713 [subsurface metagenome]